MKCSTYIFHRAVAIFALPLVAENDVGILIRNGALRIFRLDTAYADTIEIAESKIRSNIPKVVEGGKRTNLILL